MIFYRCRKRYPIGPCVVPFCRMRISKIPVPVQPASYMQARGKPPTVCTKIPSVGWYIEYFPSFETNKSDQQLTFKPKAEFQTSSRLFMRIRISLGINIIRH